MGFNKGFAKVSGSIPYRLSLFACFQANGKAERAVWMLIDMWHNKGQFETSEHRQKKLCRFIDYYNTIKPHSGLKGPFEVL